jgi:hypothetical protein
MFRKNTPYKRKVIIAVAFLATIVVLVSSPGKKYEADILDKKINTSVPTPEEVLLVSESNSEEDTETPDKTSDKVEAETEEKQEGKTEGKATEQSDKEDNTGTEQAEAEETAQEIKETKTGEAETPELQEEVADPANKENENTTKNQESEAIGGPETEGIADISEPEAQTEEGKKEVVKGNINEEQAAEENTETEKTPEDAEDVETDTTKDDEKEEIGNINDQEVSKRALGGTAGQKAETLETEETNAIEKEEASEKMQKRTDRIQKRLENTDLSPEKRDVLLARLDRLENPQEKIRIKNLKNEIRNMRREAVLEKNLETEMDVKTIAPIRNKIIQARQQKAAPEKEALKNELKREGKARMERLKAINEELERETEEFIAQELPELTEAEKEEVKKVIEPDFVYELMDEPVEETPLFSDDPQLGEQWAVESIINDQLSIVNEWGTDGDSEPVIVAIIDTGVDLSHEDLAEQFWTSESCVDDLGELIEGGCLFGGYDFVDEDTNPMVEDGATHGTAVAGIIGARTDNGVGIASVSKNGVRVMALKVAEDGLLTSESITRAIHFAILNGADIINMSFGGPTPSAVMEGAIAEAEQAGVIVTAAAGNYGLDNDVTPIYPASYDLGNIISVAALDRDDSLASFSDYGVSSVDIAAPGVSVLSTVPGGYQRLSGTSFSAPMVAAVLSVLPLSESNQTVSLIDFLIPKAYAEETQPMTVGEFLNLLFNSVQSLTGLEGKVKGGKVLRFGEGGGQEGGLALQGLKEGVGIDELLDQVVNRSTGLGKTQDFLEEYPGILKDYIDEQGGGSADIDSATSVPSRETIIVMLELKTKAITDPNLTNEQIENVFGISDEEIRQMWFGYSNSPIANPPYGPPGVEWNNFSEEDYQIYLEDTSKFYRQMDYYHRYYNMIISGAWEITDAITFPDGSQITIEQCPVIPIEEKPYDECTRIFALKVMLAKLADSKEQYEHWVSFEEGSFFGIYNKFFGFPNRLFEDSPPLPPPTPLSELELDFLKSAYVKSDSCGIASMFDHQSPDYTENDYTVLFSGRRLNSANNKIGYNSYDGHNGLDVHVRDCSRDGGGSNPLADNGKPLYAAADGIVDEINDKQRDHPYGYYVIIRHDVNGDGFFDFKTRYGHLKTPPVVQENHPIKTGDFIGIAGNTGASTGTHLHFHVSRFFYTGNNPDTDEDINKNESDGSTSSSIIDSFGWWGTEDNLVNGEGEVLDDPWEAQNSDLSSLWLFESGSYVDNESLPTACNDGIDNDGDGKIDYSEDTSGDNGCASRYDDNETSANNEPRHDASNSFFSFNYQSYPWQRQEGSAINGSALYTFGSHEPSMKWSNWSWWTGKVEEARRYEVFVHIPDIQPEFVAKSRIDNIGLTEAQKNAIWEFNRGVLNDGNDNYYENSNYKAAFKIQNRSDLEQLSFWDSLSVQQQNAIYDVWDNRVSTTATYHIFHAKEDGTGLEKHEVTINPEENVGKWVSLGVYNFAKGAHGAVRLIDEVTAENHGKIVWADAVKWEPANGPRLKVTYNGTELSSNNTLSFPQSEIDQTSEISLILRNEGNEPLEISSLNISPLSSPFELVGNSASIQLQPETEMVLSLEFSPDENGFFDAELNILHNAFGGSFVLHLQGYTHFSDVPNNHWAKPYIQYVSDLGVIQGKGDGSFDPNGYATRAEVLKMAYEGKKINTGIQSGSSGFSDIPESEWYYPYVKHAKEAGYVNGASCGTEICFYPNAPISRYEAAKMIHAVFTGTKYNENNSGGIDGKCAGDNSSFYPSNTKIQFSDVGTNDWYCVPVYWMRLTEAEWNGWVFSLFSTKDPIAHGYESGYFAYENASDTEPKNINRAEMAKIIANAMNASGTGPDNIDFQEMTLQSDEEYPESISIGNNYEQIFDETNQNAPDPVHLNPDSTDTKTITASETLTITKETHDADNDELFYFWNATGGTFTTSDETNFHEVTWHPPQVTEDTVFEINVTRGDGRGLIGEGHFEITVTPDDNTPPAPEPLIPTIHSTASGGNWNDAGTWVENQVPTDDDVVEINGTVTVYNDETAAGLKVNSGGQLWNRYNYSRTLTVNGDIENAGSIRNNTAGSRLSINVSGNIINTGAWTNYSTTFTGTDSRVINTEAPITGSVTFGESFELLSSPEFNGSTNFNGKTITLVSGHSITVRNNTTLPVTITGGGGLIFDGGNQNISGTITAENIIFSGSGAKTIYGDSAFNGNLKVSSGIIVWNRYNYSRTLTVNGDIENAGTIRNNSTRYLMVYVSGNITNTGTWTNYQNTLNGTGQKYIESGNNKIGGNTVLGDNFEVIGNPVFTGSLNLNGKTLTINTPNSAQFGGMTGTGTINGDGSVASTGNTTATINGDIPLFEMSGGDQNISGTITAENIIFSGSGAKTIYGDSAFNGNLKVSSGIIVWNRYKYSRTLTVNGDIENAGSIRNNTAGSRLSINVSGNIINTGAWTNYSTKFTGTDSRVINTEAPITGSVTFGESFELLSSPEFNGSTNFNGKTITLVSGHSITVRNNTTLPVTITGGGGLIFDGGNQNISGTITAENIIFSGSGAKTIYGDSAFNGNLKVSSGIIVWNRYNYSRTLTVNGDIENAGTIRNNSTRYLMVYVSGNITNTGSWTNHRTSLIWKPIPGAQEHQIRIRNASTGEQNTISLGSLSSYNISNFLTTKHLQWWIRQKVGGAWEEWSDVFTITTEKANIPQPGQLFLDVTPDSWEYPFVNHAASRNIISSDADNPGFFRPGDPSTRAEVLKMAYGAVGKVITAACETGQPLPFPDVSNDAWYCDLVKDAEGKGYVTGEGDGLFHPNDAISRAAAVTMLSRVFEIGEEEADCLVQKDLYKSYGDVSPDDESQSWFYTPVYWMSNVFVRTTDGDLDLNMVRNGLLIKGYEDNLFRPERNLLRSEAAKLVVNTKNFFRDPQVQAKKNSKGENCAPVFAALSLQDAEVIPPTVSIGKLYEQITDAEDTNNTAPAPLTLEGGATSATIYANESLPITAPVVDADGDLLFAFWNAIAESGNSAGAFSAEDKVRFTKVIWTPPWVSEETVFTINGTVGDGRGKVGYGTFTITVLPVTSITSVSGGGLWNDAATWNSGQVPGPNDNVIIDSEVVLNTDAIVKTLQITKNGRLIKANEGGPFKMTIIGNLYNDGQLGEPDTGSGENDDGFDLDVKGDLINSDTGSVHNQKNTVSGTVHNDGNYSGGLRTTTLPDVSEIPGDEPFTGTLELKNNFVLEKDLEVPGTVDLGGNVITIPKYETLAVDNLAGSGTIMGDGVLLIRGDIMVSDLVLNVGTLLFDDDDQQVSGAITAPNMIFENGIKSFGNTTLNGNVFIKGEVTFQNIPGINALLYINGTLNNEGKIRNAPLGFLSVNSLELQDEVPGFSVRITGAVTNVGIVENSSIQIIGDLTSSGTWSGTDVILTWDEAANAEGYELSLATGGEQYWREPILVLETSYRVTSEVIQNGLYWRVRPIIEGTAGDWSEVHSVNADPADIPEDIETPPPSTDKLFCPEMEESVLYEPSTADIGDCSDQGAEGKTLLLLNSACDPIIGARVNLRRENGSYITNAKTDANGVADFSAVDLSTSPSRFEADYNGAQYQTKVNTFESGIVIQTKPISLTLKDPTCSPIANARINLRRENGSYVTNMKTGAEGTASFEIVPNAQMKLEADFNGGTWMSEAKTSDTKIILSAEKFSFCCKTVSRIQFLMRG